MSDLNNKISFFSKTKIKCGWIIKVIRQITNGNIDSLLGSNPKSSII